MLCMTEKLLNSSVKKPLWTSSNTLLFGNAIDQELVDIKDMGTRLQAPFGSRKVTTATNDVQLKRRYANYKTTPLLRQRNMKKANDFSDIDHDCVTAPISIAHIMVESKPLTKPILVAQKWIKDPANGDHYIRMVEAGKTRS